MLGRRGEEDEEDDGEGGRVAGLAELLPGAEKRERETLREGAVLRKGLRPRDGLPLG